MKRVVVPVIIILAVALIAAGCSTETTPTGTKPISGGTLVYASGVAEPTCLGPHVGGNYPQALVATEYLESLVSKNTAGEFIPWLVTKWTESPDGLSWDSTLRKDVKFTDGTALTPHAIAANIAPVQDPAAEIGRAHV